MKLTAAEFAKSFGVLTENLSANLTSLIASLDLEISPITGESRDKLITQIIERIRNDKQIIAGDGRTETWTNGWAENLEAFKSSGGNVKELTPRFVRAGQPVRWQRKYVQPNTDNFELAYIEVLRHFIIENYFAEVSSLYEFGAGTGFNLVHASQIRPEIALVGTDFVQPAVDLINEVGVRLGINLTSSIFDMMRPEDFELELPKNSGVWTFGSLEQLGGQIEPIINYLISNKPKICVHVETMSELYDDETLEDYLADWFQTKRGYTSGLIPLLKQYEMDGRITVNKIQRLEFGSLMMEGYNLGVWTPNA